MGKYSHPLTPLPLNTLKFVPEPIYYLWTLSYISNCIESFYTSERKKEKAAPDIQKLARHSQPAMLFY